MKRNRKPTQNQRHVRHTPGRGWLFAKRPVLRFVLIFAAIIAAANIALVIQGPKRPMLQHILRANASAGAAVLALLGENASADGTEIRSPRFAMSIAHGCDAVQPIILLLAAMLATPVRIRDRLIGCCVGTVILLALNLVRIVSLYYVGAWKWRSFDLFHIDVWGSLFVIFAVVLWIVWAKRVLGHSVETPDNARS